jgi:hypothetical protein
MEEHGSQHHSVDNKDDASKNIDFFKKKDETTPKEDFDALN